MLDDNSFQRLSDSVIEVAEEITLKMIQRIKRTAVRLSRGQEPDFSREDARKLWEEYNKNAKAWTDENLPKAYLQGIKQVESQVGDREELEGNFQPQPMFGGGGGGSASDKAQRILDSFKPHLTMYSVFQDAAYNEFSQTEIPVVRDVQSKIRELIVQSSEAQYTQADEFTRLQFSQDLMNRFADDNITGIKYADGRTMKLDTYSEVVARSQTGNAARQAALNRQQEYGLDLVQISQHFPTSDLCAPWQARVYSISGTDTKYTNLQTAIDGGLFHANCKHFQSAYIEGASRLPENKLDTKENRRRYKVEQRQRAIERKIRKYKRRKAAALTEDAEKKAQSFISKWQKNQRELIDQHSFLRRKYFREQI